MLLLLCWSSALLIRAIERRDQLEVRLCGALIMLYTHVYRSWHPYIQHVTVYAYELPVKTLSIMFCEFKCGPKNLLGFDVPSNMIWD